MNDETTIRLLTKTFRDFQFALVGLTDDCSWRERDYHRTSKIARTDKDGGYCYIPAEEHVFLSQLEKVVAIWASQEPVNFLEVGCGIGTKMLLALSGFRHFGIPVVVSGIEKNSAYLEIARKVLPPETEFHECDALFFPDYGKYDVIYFWRPFTSTKTEISLEKEILSSCKPGAIVWSYGDFVYTQDYDFVQNGPEFESHDKPLPAKPVGGYEIAYRSPILRKKVGFD